MSDRNFKFLFVDVRYGIIDGYYPATICSDEHAENIRQRLNDLHPKSQFVTTRVLNTEPSFRVGSFCFSSDIRTAIELTYENWQGMSMRMPQNIDNLEKSFLEILKKIEENKRENGQQPL